MLELNDEDCVPAIKEFVRTNPDIEVYDYIRRGCNGEVYFGRRKKMGDDVVLKFYWSKPNYDETEECVILQKIKHENILEVKECRFLPPNYAYFLTPKISGGDLQGIIDSRSISSKEALQLISGILMGLTELHSGHSLVHRDLKPGNILVDTLSGQPIIADLGAVKKIDMADGFVTASKTTYLFLPPEALKENVYYFQSDIYQVGIIMFQLLNGFFPINEQLKWLSSKEQIQLNKITNSLQRDFKFEKIIADKIKKGKFTDVKSLPFYLDNNYKRIVSKATHLNYKQRYSNPAFFLRDIHNALRDTPDYLFEHDVLSVSHDSGRKYKMYKDKRGDLVVEQVVVNGRWQKKNAHDGSLDSVLKLMRKA